MTPEDARMAAGRQRVRCGSDETGRRSWAKGGITMGLLVEGPDKIGVRLGPRHSRASPLPLRFSPLPAIRSTFGAMSPKSPFQARLVPAVVGVTAAALLMIGGCSPTQDGDPYRPVADVQELMFHVVEPAAQTYWGAVGWIVDEEGEHYIRPESEEEWIAVENAAFTVAESGNLLMMAERALDDDGWITMSRSLVDVGERAVRAAEEMDEQRVFDLGAEMYYVCSNCHARYSPEILRPSDERSVDEAATDDGSRRTGAVDAAPEGDGSAPAGGQSRAGRQGRTGGP